MVLIFSREPDVHTAAVAREVSRCGESSEVLDFADCQGKVRASLQSRTGRFHLQLRTAQGEVDAESIGSIWLWRAKFPQEIRSRTALGKTALRDESPFEHLWRGLKGHFWVSHPESIRRGENKILQLKSALDLGLRIPRTLVTNDREEAHEFLKSFPNGVICKTMTPASTLSIEGEQLSVFTTRLASEDLDSLDSISFCPAILQEEIRRKVDLRVIVIGARAFAFEIESGGQEDSKVDWRLNAPSFSVHRLPGWCEKALIEFVRMTGLHFSCLDLVNGLDGSYVFLESNPCGQWLWLERATGVPLTRHLAQMLVQGTPFYRL